MTSKVGDLIQTNLGGAYIVGFERHDSNVKLLPMSDTQSEDGGERFIIEMVDGDAKPKNSDIVVSPLESRRLGDITMLDAYCIGAIHRNQFGGARGCPWDADYVQASPNPKEYFSGYYSVGMVGQLRYFGIYGWSGSSEREPEKFVASKEWLRIVDDIDNINIDAFDSLCKLNPLLAAHIHVAIRIARLELDDDGASENAAFDYAESLGFSLDERELLHATAGERLDWLIINMLKFLSPK